MSNAAAWDVEAFEVIEYIGSRLVAGSIRPARYPFGLEGPTIGGRSRLRAPCSACRMTSRLPIFDDVADDALSQRADHRVLQLCYAAH